MIRRVFRVGRVLVVGGMLVLSACTATPPTPEARVEPKPVQPRVPTRAERIETLLAQADRALARGRLLSPDYDNAYDRYAAVQLLDADNIDARAGLQAIVLRYLDMARDASQRSRIDDAENYLNRAARILPADERVQSLIADQRQQLIVRPQQIDTGHQVLLNTQQLAQRSEAIKMELTAIAGQAREQDQMVLIVARNDAEGRWIYQQMREAVAGYLLRGDIRVGTPVRIEFVSEPE